MDFVNETPFQAGWTLGFERDARELIVVAVKATFDLVSSDDPAALSSKQVPLFDADKFTGDPASSAPLYESDYAHQKPRCDVLLNGSAYAERGRPAPHVNVGIKLDAMSKVFRVTGPRHWCDHPVVGVIPGQPEPFTSTPISYDTAFGGIDVKPDEPSSIQTYLENPVGKGFRPYKKGLHGQEMPVTEELGQPIEYPAGRYRPMALGSIGRNWKPRYELAGTYDQAWLDDQAPFWPHDFDFAYFQAAPADQQIPYPAGGEELILRNVTPQGYLRTQLPRQEMPVLFIPHTGREREVQPVVDTIVIEPDLQRFSMTWRARFIPSRDCFDLKRVVIGMSYRKWRRSHRFAGKKYYAGLGELIRDKKGLK
jgi:hypothetical protein